MNRKFLWITALVFSFLLSQTAVADSWSCRKGMEDMVGSLKLDKAQKEKVKPILEQLKSQMKDKGVRRLPVVSADNSLVGIISMDDITALLTGMLYNVVRTVDHQQRNEIKQRP